ncbi:hypothetical protein [Arthrospiribacter ruber]|uniref:Lipoprotein n=1 Tax=Arthrospiribacter ruber TaxID=2487934 RepID=A0A951MEW8_9BACT|nr:hypothetical protein [Arthrospiribacter ruber]MBW3469497.1 hypothetical protein [Arthrospiribacter ruber]
MRKLLSYLPLILFVICIVSCTADDEDENPCGNENFTPFLLQVVDQSGENILAFEEVDPSEIQIYYLNDENEEEMVDFMVYNSSIGAPYIFSRQMTILSISEVHDFVIRLNPDNEVQLNYIVNFSEDTGCRVYDYEARDQNNNELQLSTEGSPRTYLVTVAFDPA